MKKITFSLLMSLLSFGAFAQLATEGFETWPPTGWIIEDNNIGIVNSWTQSSGSSQPAYAGDHAAFINRETVAGTAEDWLITPAFTVPANPVLRFHSRLTIGGDDGTLYKVYMYTGDASDDPSDITQNYSLVEDWTELQINPIQTQYTEVILPLTTATPGATIRLAFVMAGNDGDRWLIDNVRVVSLCAVPTDLAVNNIGTTSANLTWANPGGATSWEIEVLPAAGAQTGVGVVYNGSLPYVPTLLPDTVYKYYVRAVCAADNKSAWAGPFNFTTAGLGDTCAAAIQVPGLPYSTTDNTSNYGDTYYEGDAGSSGCGSTSNYLDGNDVVYSYTPTFTGNITIDVSGTDTYTGVFVYNECGDIGVNCIAGAVNDASTNPLNIATLAVTAGEDYFIVISTWPAPQTTPYTLTIQQVFCAQPVGQPTTGITDVTANLSWTNPGSASSWQVVVQPAGTGLPTASSTIITANTNSNFPLASLTASTAYEYYVRAACADGNFSIWSGPYPFTTTQVPATMNYIQDFETPVHGWTLANGTQTNKWAVGTAANNGGANGLYISNDNGTSNAYTTNSTTVVHTYRDIQMPVSFDQLSLSFDWKSVGDANDHLRVWLVPASFVPATGNLINGAADRLQVGNNFTGNNTWATSTNTINASAFAGQVVRLVFEWRNNGFGGTQPPAAVDNISLSVIACPSPIGLALDDIGQNEADISWDPLTSVTPTFDYYYSTTNTAPTAATVPTGNNADTDMTLSGLAPSTNYFFWVRSNCGSGSTSAWTGPLSFTTTQIPATMDYAQDFETPAHGWALSNGSQTNIWSVGSAVSNGGTQALYITDDNGVSNSYDSGATSVVHAYRDIQMPATLADVSLSFDWRSVGENNWDYLRVWLVPVTYAPVPGTQILADTGRQQVGNNYQGGSSWATVNAVIDASDYAGQAVRLVFEWTNDSGGGSNPPAAVDNIAFAVITCSSPSDLELDAVSLNDATISWTAPAAGTPTYDYYLATANTTVNDATVPSGNFTSTTGTIPGLVPSTAYYVWVRSNCGSGDTSFWIGPLQFNTPQIPATLDFTEGFEGTNQWTFTNGTQTNKWVVGTAVSNGGTQSLYISQDDGANNSYNLASNTVTHAYRDIAVPATVSEIDLSFDWRAQGEDFGWDQLRVWIVPITFTPTPLNVIDTDSGGQQIGGDFVMNGEWLTANYIIDASDYAGETMRLVFQWKSDTSGGTQPPAAVDNIDVSIITCPKPTDLAVDNITQTTASLEWEETGTATQWEVYVVTEDTPAPTDDTAGMPVSAEPHDYATLQPATTYDYYVRAVCAADDKSKWAGPFTFITAIGNDDCEGATALTVNPTEECAAVTEALFTDATASAGTSSCAGTNGGDIWFEFTAEGTSHAVKLLNFEGEALPVILSLYEGDVCGTLTEMYCSINNVINATGLVAGTTYKVRAELNDADPDFSTAFDVCVTTPPPPSAENPTECVITTINYDFEMPGPPEPTIYPHFVNHNVVQGWRTTAADEEMEFWSAPNYENVPAYSGSQFIELNANLVSGVYQDYQTPQVTEFNYAFAHRGRQGTDTCELLAGPPGGPYVTVTTATTGNTEWGYYTGTYTVPAGQPVTRFIFQSISSVGGVSVGNYLDAITFSANNGILSANPMALDCENRIATVSAAGVGTWTANPANPSPTVIADATNNETTISGFELSGNYLYTWTTQYCTSTLEIAFDSGDIPAPVVTPEIHYCQTQTATALTAEALAGNTLSWYADATGGTALPGAPTPDTSAEGTTTYYVSQSTAESCISPRAAITVTVNAPAAAVTAFTIPAEFCIAEANPIPVPDAGYTTGGTYSAGAGLDIDPTTGEINLAGSEPGDYTITYTVDNDIANCIAAGSSTASITINEMAAPVIAFDYNESYCFGEGGVTPSLEPGFATGGTFTADGGLTINAATGEVNIASGAAGTYTITYTITPDVANCIAGGTSTDTFIINKEMEVAFSGDCEDEGYIVNVSAENDSFDVENASYEWINAAGTPVGTDSSMLNITQYVNSTPGEDTFPIQFFVTVTNNGCEASATITVEDIACTIQRGISPNNDDKNDSFDLTSLNVKHLSIFNRYGQEVYSRTNYTTEWHGQSKNGDELPTGTYYYMIERTNGENTTGWIYINREEN